MKTTDTEHTLSPSPLQAVRWPLVVVAMLLGHVVLMMSAVVLSATIPGAVRTVDGFENSTTSATTATDKREAGVPEGGRR